MLYWLFFTLGEKNTSISSKKAFPMFDNVDQNVVGAGIPREQKIYTINSTLVFL